MTNPLEITRLSIQLFCVSTLFAMGLGITLDDVKAPFRNLLALTIIIAVNNLLVPLLGLLIVTAPTLLQGGIFAELAEQIVPLTEGQQLGLLLAMLASGSLLGPVFAQTSGAPAPFARGVMVVLAGVSALLLPFELELLSQFRLSIASSGQAIESSAIFITLLVYQLLPLAVGVLIKMRYDAIAERLRPLIVQLAGLTFLVMVSVLLASGEALISLPGKAPGVRTEVPGGTIEAPTSEPTSADVLAAVKGKVGGKVSADAAVQALTEETWMVFTPRTTYITGYISPTLSVLKTDPVTVSFAISATPQEIANRVTELNARQISAALVDNFETDGDIELSSDLAVVIEEDHQWALVNAADTFFIEAESDSESGSTQLTLYQELPEPSGVIGQFVKTLEALPVIGPVIDFLTQIVVILVPYLLFAAVAALLLVIGNYAGVAVRNLVGVSGNAIPHTLATTTAVRGVTMALIVVVNHPVTPSKLVVEAIAVVLVFFVVSLAVAAHQAVQWGKAAEPARLNEPATESAEGLNALSAGTES